MNVETLSAKDKYALNEYVLYHQDGSLSQTYEWGEFQKDAGFKVWRLGVWEKGQIVGAVTVLKYDMPYGKWYLYAPRMIVSNDYDTITTSLVNKIREIAEKENCILFRYDSLIVDKDWYSIGGVKAPKEIQPRDTVVLDLCQKEDDEILKGMKSKWRYNIRLAARKGVTVRQSTEQKDLDAFFEIAKTTAERDNFHIHSKKYYQALFDNLVESGFVKLFVAEYEGKILAVNIVSRFKDTATYLHGASSNEHRNLMAPHLLQWEAIKQAKKDGYTRYDFYGVAPKDEPNHPWAGITRFKEGFGGERVQFVGAYDIVYNSFWYSLMKLAFKFRK